MEFPRILVLTSNNFNTVTGGGITLTNLFSGWPADRIANVHEDSHPEDRRVCNRFYRLTTDEIRWTWPMSLVEPKSNGTSSLAGSSAPNSPAVGLSRKLFGDGVPRKFVVTPALARWIDEFQPQAAYSFLGSMAQIRVASGLTARFNIPLVVHIMDDWPAVIYTSGTLAPLLRRTVMSEFKNLLRKAKARLAISEEMCRDYEKRFGYRFLPFHNAIDVAQWEPRARHAWAAGRPFVVRYAGSIVEEAQREGLMDICGAVSSLRSAGHDIEIWIHAPRPQRAYLETAGMDGLRLWDPPEPDSIVELLASADVLVLPFNFDERSAGYMRLSMPTKVPAYMASGTPVLVYGPARIATVKYAFEQGWGYVVFQPGPGNLQAALRRLMSDQHLRELHGRRAQRLAAERHDAVRVRAEFQAILAS